MDDVTIVIIMFTTVGMLEIIMGIPLMFEKIKPNWLYGFRLPSTVSNKGVWYPVNRYVGRGFVFAGIIVILSNLFLYMSDLNLTILEKTLVLLFLTLIPIIIIIIAGLVYLKKLT
jgi:uncharacterized membrane protein